MRSIKVKPTIGHERAGNAVISIFVTLRSEILLLSSSSCSNISVECQHEGVVSCGEPEQVTFWQLLQCVLKNLFLIIERLVMYLVLPGLL